MITEKRFLKLALNDPKGFWELHHGQLRQKPSMSVGHNDVMSLLIEQLVPQLDRTKYRLRAGAGHLRRSSESYYIPDIAIIPLSTLQRMRARPRDIDVFPDPLPLVVEIWSPSTGIYDAATKVPEYQLRGDLEIWLIHPFEHRLTTWRREPDGTYTEAVFTSGEVSPKSIPNVLVDLDALLEGISD